MSVKWRVVITAILVVVHIAALAVPYKVREVIWCDPPINQAWCDSPFSDVIGFDFPFPIIAAFFLGSIGYEAFKAKTLNPKGFWAIWFAYAFCLWILFPQVQWRGPEGNWDAMIGNPAAYDALVGAAMFFPVVVLLFLIEPMIKGNRLDWWLGQLAYPLFLTHFLAGWIVIWFFGFPITAGEQELKPLYVSCLAAGVLSAFGVALLQIHVIDRFRYRVRGFGSINKPTTSAN